MKVLTEFDMKIVPPTVTAQERKVAVVNGRPHFYDPLKVREARRLLCNALTPYKPAEPFTGALKLEVVWRFPTKSHKDGEWRATRPDTDNLQKLLKDCMTACGYWQDDAQVVWEDVKKLWVRADCGISVKVTAV